MRLVALAVVVAGLCIAAAITDCSATVTPSARFEWNLWALVGLVLFGIGWFARWD